MREPPSVREQRVQHLTLFLLTPNLENAIGLTLIIMKDAEKREEMVSRRQFFKKAAKATLPILGAFAVLQAPIVAKAMEQRNSCYSGCSMSCSGGCEGCSGSCRGGCQYNCGSGCTYGCEGSCMGNCTGSCNTSCQGSCSGGCSGQNYSYPHW